MDNDAAALQNLERLMTEFFVPETTNERKRTIEQSFQEFAQQIDSWRPCLHFLSSTNNHYVSMFALSTLETTIGRRWPILLWEDRALTRSTLYTLSLERDVAPFVRNKVVKLVVDIARHDWPHFYPDFYSNILQLLGHKHTRLLGLIYLRTASEELATPRDDLPIHRKNELFRFLSAQVPLTLETLTITPPPSPTGGQTVAPARAILDVERGLASGTTEVCIATLEVLAHLFSWIELSEHISTGLLDAIFTCANYHDAMNVKQIEMSVQAVTTINELLYRPLCSPDVTDRLLVEIFQNGVTLFQLLERLDSVNESYMEKLTEFLQLFVTNHLKRIESSPKFSVNTLLEVLCHHTFQQCSTVNGYLRSLDVWATLLENGQSRYSPVTLALCEQVLQKISFKLNTRTLKDLDTENLDENEETEWQHFLRCNIECLAKVADISPIPVFTLLYRTWREELMMFGELGTVIVNNQVILLNESEAANVHAHLRDLASTTQVLARLYSLFLGDDQNIDQTLAEEVVSQTLDACKFANTNQLYKASLQPAAIVIDLIEVHSQLLASLQAWCHWIASRPQKVKETFCRRCIDSCILALDYTTFCDNPLPTNLTHSATHLFQSITAILKPVLWDEPTFRNLISMMTYPFFKPDTIKVLRRALVNAIILPPGDGSIRERLLGTMISTLSTPLGSEGQPVPSESSISITVVPLTQLLEDCSASSTTIKKMLHSCLGPTINRILELLPYTIRCQSICEILLSFLHSVFSVLQQQLGPEFIQNAVQGMLHIYTRENISVGPALDQLLEILILVVSAPSNAFKAFVPSITTLCLGQVWPAVGNDLSAHPDTTLVLLKLFYSILMHRWQYFYNASILHTLGHTDEDEPVEHKEELVAILEAFGQALLQPDVNIFRQSLQGLEQLNVRWRLYQRTVFKVHLIERFLMALFTVLSQQSHNLLADEIATAIHSLASVNIAWFFGHFLPTFLSSCDGVDDMQKATLLENFDKSTDQPTLTRSVLQLIADLRCYQFFLRPG
ncbi:exportin-6-B isoform X2 [Ceratina calcarata]|uniref:Exportin-6-B isoform X2 n=1 Tax=Ceratina calcarata TaxID=156304 RepID=A0AAJ7S6E3_9HYME|nr:exportin-6-B isoform X2 [Ceratina calcarata]